MHSACVLLVGFKGQFGSGKEYLQGNVIWDFRALFMGNETRKCDCYGYWSVALFVIVFEVLLVVFTTLHSSEIVESDRHRAW